MSAHSFVWVLFATNVFSGSLLPLGRTSTLVLPEVFPLESEHARIIKGERNPNFIYPRDCDATDSSWSCRDHSHLQYKRSDRQEYLGIDLLSGAEYRYQGSQSFLGEFGIMGSGRNGPLHLDIDARLFNGKGPNSGVPFDREGQDRQLDSITGTISYDSFSRYRGTVSLKLPFGTIAVARDGAHWGPGLLENLVFGQDAIPFPQYRFTTSLGPLTLTSLYGDLAVDDIYISDRNHQDRKIYAHRYELKAMENLLIGISEQLVLYEDNAPYLFAPIFPLFMAKSLQSEGSNNGSLSADVFYRVASQWGIYSEFLLDDLESPLTLFTKDYSQNKWGWMAGVHWVKSILDGDAGVVLEYARLEPWLYTHFTPYSAQTANLGYPLGNQDGPNSQSVKAKVYFKRHQGGYLSFQPELLWKGKDLGSQINDPAPANPTTPKIFLANVASPNFSTGIFASLPWNGFAFQAGYQMGAGSDIARLRISYIY